MKKILFLSTAIFVMTTLMQCQPDVKEEKDAYLFVFHQDATHSLYMATSHDGYTFTAVNDAQPVMSGDTLATQHGIRDPHIYQGSDGAFYLAMTDLHLWGQRFGFRDTQWEREEDEYGWGNNHGFVLMKSYDLVNWTRNVVHIDKLFPDLNVGCAWAPETIYDPEKKQIMLYFTMRLGNGKTKLYYSYTDDAFSKLVTKPEELFKYPNPDVQILDADISQMPDGRYCLMYVAQEQPGGIKMAFSDKINREYVYSDQWADAEPGACEAPNVWKRNGEDKWVLMYDIFSINPHNFGFCETSDFKTFKDLGHFNEGVMKTTNFSSPKHGAIISITSQQAETLEKYWANKAIHSTLRDSVILSDPCILADEASKSYYMTGTGGKLWKSKDLKVWEGPFTVAKQDTASWMGRNPAIWATEIHPYKGKYYYFATFTNDSIVIAENHNGVIPRRASHILVSDSPAGPFKPINNHDYLPADRPTLDGTLWVEPDGTPYMVFCGEWLMNDDGTMEALPLKEDLSGAAGEPFLLFKASDSPWSREKIDGKTVPNRVTDGPWLFRTGTGRLGMIWTSWIYDVYTMGVAYSESGTIKGPWIQEAEPLTPPNHGHGMIFRDLNGKYLLSLHSHQVVNGQYIRRPVLFEVDLSGDKLILGKKVE